MKWNTWTADTWCRCSSIAVFLCLANAASVRAQEQFLCVWRNPERTMTRLFPEAVDYRTVNNRITAEQRTVIERELGFELLPGQRDQFQYFELLGAGGKRLGHVIAASQKGEFGAIEFVLGLDSGGAINGMYIQRAREKDVSFREKEFIDSFTGVALRTTQPLAKKLQAEKNAGRNAVLKGVLKELVTFNALTK